MQGPQMPTPLCSVKELKELPKRVLCGTSQSIQDKASWCLGAPKSAKLKSNDTRQLSGISMKARLESAVLCLGARVHTPTSSFHIFPHQKTALGKLWGPCQLINSHTLQEQQRRIHFVEEIWDLLWTKRPRKRHGVSHSKRETGNLQWKLLLCNLTTNKTCTWVLRIFH